MPRISDEKRLKRREYILDVAFKLFAEKGFVATGMRDIMREAQVSKGGIYVYFNSKDDMLLEIINKYDNAYNDIINSISLDDSADIVFTQYLRKRLTVFQNEDYLRWVRINSELWSLPHIIPNIVEIDRVRYKKYKQNLKYIVDLGIVQGIFNSECDIDNLSFMLEGTLNGMTMLAAVMYKPILTEHIEETIEMFLKYLR